jgi:L-cystine uptake protein TcyP (sodium:dicarboxylate symporter family)
VTPDPGRSGDTAIYRIRSVELLKSVAGLAAIAFVTRSSEAVLAPLMGKLEGFGVSRSTTSFVVPLGYSFNTDGSVLYLAAALVLLCQRLRRRHLAARPASTPTSSKREPHDPPAARVW